MGRITDDLNRALDVADARLKAGDAHNASRRLEEAREVQTALIQAVKALDARLDALEGRGATAR